MIKYLTFILILSSATPYCLAQSDDPLDPFSNYDSSGIFGEEKGVIDTIPDEEKSAEDLLREAILLQYDSHLLESRTKLLKALEKDPKFFQAHLALADYYSRHVGHFRLALKYAKQAENLFLEKFGPPRYEDEETKAIHGDILMMLSDARLNLDDYQGALEKNKEFEELNYYSPYHASSKAWILMKLGDLDSAIKSARFGLLTGSNTGHTLNILGILLSMTGQREESLTVFKSALKYELSLGDTGNPATPLNNSGEVYKELYQDERAMRSWDAALSLPDGCDHVLPSLNLTFINLDALKIDSARDTMDRFDSCIAQFPLKNGEEHRALVKMARGRIALQSGQVDEALALLEDSAQHQQWFGKIGTNQEDLQSAILSSLILALEYKNNHLTRQVATSWIEYLLHLKLRFSNYLQSEWLKQRAKGVLINKLENIEDIYIRHTDSMLEYPTFGTILTSIPRKVIESRIEEFKSTDDRDKSLSYYQVYLAESLLSSGYKESALEMLNTTIPNLIHDSEKLLKAHALQLKIKALNDSYSVDSIQSSYELLKLHPPAILNYNIPLVVKGLHLSSSDENKLEQGGWIVDNSRQVPIELVFTKQGEQITIKFNSILPEIPSLSVSCAQMEVCVNAVNMAVLGRQ